MWHRSVPVPIRRLAPEMAEMAVVAAAQVEAAAGVEAASFPAADTAAAP